MKIILLLIVIASALCGCENKRKIECDFGLFDSLGDDVVSDIFVSMNNRLEKNDVSVGRIENLDLGVSSGVFPSKAHYSYNSKKYAIIGLEGRRSLLVDVNGRIGRPIINKGGILKSRKFADYNIYLMKGGAFDP